MFCFCQLIYPLHDIVLEGNSQFGKLYVHMDQYWQTATLLRFSPLKSLPRNVLLAIKDDHWGFFKSLLSWDWEKTHRGPSSWIAVAGVDIATQWVCKGESSRIRIHNDTPNCNQALANVPLEPQNLIGLAEWGTRRTAGSKHTTVTSA